MKVLAAAIVFNEEKKIRNVLRRFLESGAAREADLIVIDDGSTDGSREAAASAGVRVLSHPRRSGAGAAVRTALYHARDRGYDALVVLAGNDKDEPSEISRLLEPLRAGFDFVQGSRYLPGGRAGNMPLYRRLATRFVHPWLFSLFAGRRVTDSTNGFRAVRLTLLSDPKMRLEQEWLDHYELEPYLYFQALRLGYKVTEVPVTKIYPPRELGYTKMAPVTGWWSLLRPVFLLGLGLKK